ncbi:MAG: methyltransferase domain-containing protein [Planctomycetota bacterium]
MTVPLARRVPELARFELRRRKLPFAQRTLSMIVPASLGDVVSRSALTDPDRQPYWAEIWPAAVGLARVLMRGRPLDGLRVLDVGCGLGLCGVAAGSRGARVTFTDREPEALAFARFNAEQNGVTGCETLLLDWNRRLPEATFDLLLLADVTYSEHNHEPLLRLLSRALTADGVAIAADPFRSGGAAFAGAAGHSFACRELHTDCFFVDRRLPVRLWVLARDEAVAVAWAGDLSPKGSRSQGRPPAASSEEAGGAGLLERPNGSRAREVAP